jgi:Xaa-Pro aminopeptidase
MKEKIDGLTAMRKCAALGDAVFKSVCAGLKKGKFKTELDLANFIKNEIEKTGAKESFPVIVTSGPRAGNDIHPVPTGSKLSGFVIIDFGLKMHGYCSDMTRTVYVGKPTNEEIELYNTILNAQNGASRYFKAGLPVSAPDAFVRGFLANSKYKKQVLDKYFIHTLGHGISKLVHENPKIFFKSREFFKEGKVVTNEPGIYIPKTLGIRIEDMYLIGSNAPEEITQSPKKLLVF